MISYSKLKSGRPHIVGLTTTVVVVAGLLVCAGPAAAAAPRFHVSASTRPTVLPPGGEGQLVVTVVNLGDGATSRSEPITITDKLPAGVSAESVRSLDGPGYGSIWPELAEQLCAAETGNVVRCTVDAELVEPISFVPETHGFLPYEQLEVGIAVKVTGSVSGENQASVTGAGIAEASSSEPLRIGSTPAGFGIEKYEAVAEEEDGSPDTKAGSHPFQFTTVLALNQNEDPEKPAGFAKDLHFDLPPGLVGNPTAFPQCSYTEFVTGSFTFDTPTGFGDQCPSDTALGVATVTILEPGITGPEPLPVEVPIFNLQPAKGEPARFGFNALATPVILDTAVRSGGDYGVTVNVSEIPQTAVFLADRVTFWGVPGDPRHDNSRGWECLGGGPNCKPLEELHPKPFLTLPTSCTGPLQMSVSGDSWPTKADPGGFSFVGVRPEFMESLNGCNRLGFEPSIEATPDGTAASSPSGLKVDVHVPQDESLVPTGLSESNVKDITVALPEGVAVNPAGGDGLQACSESQVGYLPAESAPPADLHFTPALSEPFCPNASKIGEVTIHSPLLPNPLKGFVYLATQNENPFGSLVAIYLVAEDPVSGVVVKLAGDVHLSETGQLSTTFENSPQLPFEDAELHFFGGERAPLATPAHCGSYETTASFAPWSDTKAVPSSSTFNITSGPNGSPCPGASLPFSPSLTGGTINNNGGAFSALSTTIGREDGQQNMSAVTLHMPTGLSGLLSGVELCPEAQANAGTCGPGSLIGETTVSAGVGSDPVSVTGGKVYITGPYHGAPFGLSIVNPVKAGPFDLEHDTSNPAQNPACDCVVVRAKIEVNPSTAALTVTTNGEGEGFAIPHLIDGIPVQIKKVNVLINRPGFAFNPTSCDPMQITGSISSAEGASSPVSVPFQVANCAILKFAPKFGVSTSGKTSKADGASLAVKLTYPNAPQGTQANIARVKVDLPKQLPSRLTTLQKACTNAQFEANPAGCPAASFIGHAKAITPLIPVPLEGPAIFVSHGGEAFPSLIMVLQGYGVRIDLVGTTFISKAGITSSTFKTVPDAPVGSFELTLPEGPYSALTANGDLCTSKLAMPTEFLAQNGAKINESTKIGVTGCAKVKALTRSQKLARALKLCHKDKSKAKRASCEKAAHTKYGPVKKSKKSSRRGK